MQLRNIKLIVAPLAALLDSSMSSTQDATWLLQPREVGSRAVINPIQSIEKRGRIMDITTRVSHSGVPNITSVPVAYQALESGLHPHELKIDRPRTVK